MTFLPFKVGVHRDTKSVQSLTHVLPSDRGEGPGRLGRMDGCLSEGFQSILSRSLFHAPCQELGVGRWSAVTRVLLAGSRFQFLSALHSVCPTRDQAGHCTWFHLPPLGSRSNHFCFCGLCRSVTLRMSKSKETPKQKLLTEGMEPRCGKEEKP